MSLVLTPNGTLTIHPLVSDNAGDVPAELLQTTSDISNTLLQLGRIKTSLPDPTWAYWQRFVHRFLVEICRSQTAENRQLSRLTAPSTEEWQHFIDGIPPMVGAEYLVLDVLQHYWGELTAAFNRSLIETGYTIQQLLDSWEADWHLSGRLYLHLAENKHHPTHPFAFLATYNPGSRSTGTSQHLPLQRALQDYAHDKEQLLMLLQPLHSAASQCAWISKMISTGDIYRPQPWTAQQAYEMLRSIPKLEASGIHVRIPNWWSAKRPPRVTATMRLEEKQAGLGLRELLDFDVQLSIGDTPLTDEEWRSIQEGDSNLVRIQGRWVEVDRNKLEMLLSQWQTLRKTTARDGISLAEGLRLLSGITQTETTETDDPTPWCEVIADKGLAERLTALRHPGESPAIDHALQDTLCAELRPYQKRGVTWLWMLYSMGLGGCLADDMGLGKTIQVLALLLLVRAFEPNTLRHLLVVPASLIGNWQREAAKFAPSLRIYVAHGSDAIRDALPDVDLVITTYGQMLRRELLQEQQWGVVILDEAQAIKNVSSKTTLAAKKLQARVRFALSGTPVENRVTDLWSLFDFILPGLLGSAREFQELWKRKASSSQFLGALRQLTQPYLLRRLKTDPTILPDLPDKIEMQTLCTLSPEQARLYQAAVDELANKLDAAENMERKGLVLSYLSQLKQICNHPDQWRGVGTYDPQASGKWQRLAEICTEIAARQERVLIFTQFRTIIPHLSNFLEQIFERPGLMLHGDTPIAERSALVEAFQREDGPPFFVLSLKAGGTGLTLTQATHVIHFDRWWNPAVENQATDRAFRIGQKRTVTVHPFTCQGTIEEKIDQLLSSKRALSDEILAGNGELALTELSNAELLELVSLDFKQAVEIG